MLTNSLRRATSTYNFDYNCRAILATEPRQVSVEESRFSLNQIRLVGMELFGQRPGRPRKSGQA